MKRKIRLIVLALCTVLILCSCKNVQEPPVTIPVIPDTTSAPEETSPPATEPVIPNTTSAPAETTPPVTEPVVPDTTAAPDETTPPVTEPVAPDTTAMPEETTPPVTDPVVPDTTAAPEDTTPPVTDPVVPDTTAAPEETTAPVTDPVVPDTTAAPDETIPPIAAFRYKGSDVTLNAASELNAGSSAPSDIAGNGIGKDDYSMSGSDITIKAVFIDTLSTRQTNEFVFTVRLSDGSKTAFSIKKLPYGITANGTDYVTDSGAVLTGSEKLLCWNINGKIFLPGESVASCISSPDDVFDLDCSPVTAVFPAPQTGFGTALDSIELVTKLTGDGLQVLSSLSKVEYHTLFCPSGLAPQDFTIEGLGSVAISDGASWSSGYQDIVSEISGNTSYTATVKGIYPIDYAQPYTVRGYLKLTNAAGNVCVVYSDINDADTVYGAAKKAFEAGDTKAKAYLDSVVDLAWNSDRTAAEPAVSVKGYEVPYTVTTANRIIEIKPADSKNGWSFYRPVETGRAGQPEEYYSSCIIIDGKQVSADSVEYTVPGPRSSLYDRDAVILVNKADVKYSASLYSVTEVGSFVGTENGDANGPKYNDANNDADHSLVGAADLGFSVNCVDKLRNDYTLLLFGDTFKTYVREADGSPNLSGHWRSNTMAKTTDYDLSDNLRIDGWWSSFTIGNGTSIYARQVIKSWHNLLKDGDETIKYAEKSKYFDGGVSVNGTVYVFFTSRRGVIDSKNSAGFGGFMKSKDGGVTWERVFDATWFPYGEGYYNTTYGASLAGKSNADLYIQHHNIKYAERIANQDIAGNDGVGNVRAADHVGYFFTDCTPVDGHDGYVYLFSRGGYRSYGSKMARVKYEDIEIFNKYEYLVGYETDGSPIWHTYCDNIDDITIFVLEGNGTVSNSSGLSNASACYNEYLGLWMAGYFKGDERIAFSKNIWGPYKSPDEKSNYLKVLSLSHGYGVFLNDKWIEYEAINNPGSNVKYSVTVYFGTSQWLTTKLSYCSYIYKAKFYVSESY